MSMTIFHSLIFYHSVFIRFGDWKIAERLQDDGACSELNSCSKAVERQIPGLRVSKQSQGLGFAEDMKGRRRRLLKRFVPNDFRCDTSSHTLLLYQICPWDVSPFSTDSTAQVRPWIPHPTLRWRLWEPSARRFVPRRTLS